MTNLEPREQREFEALLRDYSERESEKRTYVGTFISTLTIALVASAAVLSSLADSKAEGVIVFIPLVQSAVLVTYAFQMTRWNRLMAYMEYLEGKINELCRDDPLRWSLAQKDRALEKNDGDAPAFSMVDAFTSRGLNLAYKGALVPFGFLMACEGFFGLHSIVDSAVEDGDPGSVVIAVVGILASVMAIVALWFAREIYKSSASDVATFRRNLQAAKLRASLDS